MQTVNTHSQVGLNQRALHRTSHVPAPPPAAAFGQPTRVLLPRLPHVQHLQPASGQLGVEGRWCVLGPLACRASPLSPPYVESFQSVTSMDDDSTHPLLLELPLLQALQQTLKEAPSLQAKVGRHPYCTVAMPAHACCPLLNSRRAMPAVVFYLRVPHLVAPPHLLGVPQPLNPYAPPPPPLPSSGGCAAASPQSHGVPAGPWVRQL